MEIFMLQNDVKATSIGHTPTNTQFWEFHIF
jgi:hypothetical protein